MSAATSAWAADACVRASAQVVGAPPSALGSVVVVVGVVGALGVVAGASAAHSVVA
jgi:hypothetical protein